MLAILKRRCNVFEHSILKLHPKSFNSIFFKRGKDELCLTQGHYLRDKERLRFKDGKKAKDVFKGVHNDTSHLIVGKFDDHS